MNVILMWKTLSNSLSKLQTKRDTNRLSKSSVENAKKIGLVYFLLYTVFFDFTKKKVIDCCEPTKQPVPDTTYDFQYVFIRDFHCWARFTEKSEFVDFIHFFVSNYAIIQNMSNSRIKKVFFLTSIFVLGTKLSEKFVNINRLLFLSTWTRRVLFGTEGNKKILFGDT